MSSHKRSTLKHLVLGLKGRIWCTLNTDKRNDIVNECFHYWRKRGFPYYRLNDSQIIYEYGRLSRVTKDRVITRNDVRIQMAGVRLANNFHPQMWEVPVGRYRSPMGCFRDDETLRKIIRRAFTVFQDRYSVNPSNLRRMLRTFSDTASVSNFRPTAAKAIYELFSKENDCVLDFSAGYGGRLLGCLPLRLSYIGIEPCTAQVRGLRHMLAKLRSLVSVQSNAEIIQDCAEDYMPTLPSSHFGLVFSSPPYFDRERYSIESSQSYIRHPTYEKWFQCFLKPIVAEAHRVLRPGGYFIINMADVNGLQLAKDGAAFATRYFRLVRTLRLRLANKPYLRRDRASPHRVEPIFVFQKRRR